jgi:hypothetical protein
MWANLLPVMGMQRGRKYVRLHVFFVKVLAVHAMTVYVGV